MSKYVLPDLPYDFGALEPCISGRIMELHHDKHHRAYVDGANRAIDQLLEARHAKNFAAIAAISHAMAFNVSGHVLHSLFWQNLSPTGGGRPSGELANVIDRDFGSFDALVDQMNASAAATMGSGWVLLVYEPVLGRLGTTLVHDHQSEITQGSVPLLALDAWEHAYYLQYENDKAQYFRKVWEVFDWEDVDGRFQRARGLELEVGHAAEAPPPQATPIELPH
jgi:Fe-Mn family superoxide dismutase